MGQVTLATLTVRCSEEQQAILIARQTPQTQLVKRLNRVCQDAVNREIARLTTAGPESPPQRRQAPAALCNACRQARAEACAECDDWHQ